MVKLITQTKTRLYYEKGDKVKFMLTGDILEVDKIILEKGVTKLITTGGACLTLTPDFKPTDETLKKCTIMDKSKSVAKSQPSKDIVNFAKANDSVILPTKLEEDGAYDVYANFEEDFMVIAPQTVMLIPTGVHSAFDPKYRFVFKERGSTGTKLMEVRAGVIDSGFRGEWKVALSNGGTKTLVISKLVTEVTVKETRIIYPYNKAICQADLEEVPVVTLKTISLEDLKAIPSRRGETMLGASGK